MDGDRVTEARATEQLMCGSRVRGASFLEFPLNWLT